MATNDYIPGPERPAFPPKEKQPLGPKALGGRRLFQKANPGSPGKLGKTSTKAESLSKLRGKGALA